MSNKLYINFENYLGSGIRMYGKGLITSGKQENRLILMNVKLIWVNDWLISQREAVSYGNPF